MRRVRVLALFILAAMVFSTPGVTPVEAQGSSLQTSSGQELLADRPEVTLEAMDKSGTPVEGAWITILSLTDGGEIVFQGQADPTGRVHFASSLPATANIRRVNVIDAVYEAYFVAPTGEIQVRTFSVPHVKELAKTSVKDRESLERGRIKTVTATLNVAEKMLPSQQTQPPNDAEVGIMALGCTYLGYDSKVCVEDEQTSSQLTLIAKINVGNQERVDFTLTQSANVSLQSGFKSAEGSPWGIDISYTQSADTSTGIDYSFTGTCVYVGGYTCNPGRNVFAYYSFLYQKKAYYYKDGFLRREWTVKPMGLFGSTSYYEWYNDSRNGKPVTDVIGGMYGAKFEIFNDPFAGSTTRSYTTEKTFAAAFTVPTPVGSFTGGLTTAYKSAHTIKWSTTSSTHFWHYDYSTSNGDLYVTQ